MASHKKNRGQGQSARKMSDAPKLPQAMLGVAATAALHPFTYAKVLIQLGYEPIPATYGRSMLGKAIFIGPNIFRYMGHIRRADGFTGLYRGIFPKIIGGFVSSSVSSSVHKCIKEERDKHCKSASMDELDGVDEYSWTVVLQNTTQETLVRCAGVIVSQPFQVIMIRQMAQFIGKETRYDGVLAPIKEVYNNDGILGFFSGLIPRLLCEVLTIWMANTLAQILNQYIMQPNKEMKSYTSGLCSLVVTQFTYPLNLVSNVMAVKGSGLKGAGPEFAGWWECYAQLARQNQLKRGSSMFWRRYTGPSELMPTL